MLNNSTLKIFLVNDDVFCLTMYQQLLENMGYKDIRVFASEAECLDTIAIQPDVILMNCSLHMQPGIELLKTIKQHYPGIYVVVVSGNENRQVIDQVLKLGAFDYIISGAGDAVKIQAVLLKIQQIQMVLRTKPNFIKKDNNNKE